MSGSTTPHKPVIGLVGGIGSGKSTVARAFAALGCAVINADELAQAALDEPEVRAALISWWGDRIVDSAGRVDRRGIGDIVFSDADSLHRLEGLIHPRVLRRRAELHKRLQADPAVKAVVEDTPLLMDKGLDADCDVVIFVKASLPQRQRRVRQARGWSAEELARREKNQVALDIKARRAQYKIDNDVDPAHCQEQVRRVFSQILATCA